MATYTKRPNMASLLPERFFEISGQGPSPTKDFYYLAVTKSDVIWRWWRISLRNDCRNSKPGEMKESHQDYLDDSQLQSQVRLVFGPPVLQYTQALCQGHYDYLVRLPDPLLLRILAHLELEDVGRLGCTSRRFRKLCASEEVWEQAVQRCCGKASAEVSSLALEVGWRSIFFTSKLQLQKQISRRRRGVRQQREEKVFGTDTEMGTMISLRSHTQPPGEIPQADIVDHDAEVEPCPATIHNPSPGTGHGSDTSHSSDFDSVPNPNVELGSDTSTDSDPVTDQLYEDLEYCVVTTPAQDVINGDAGSGRGDYCTKLGYKLN